MLFGFTYLDIASYLFLISYNLFILLRLETLYTNAKDNVKQTWRGYVSPILETVSHIFFLLTFTIQMFNIPSIIINGEFLFIDVLTLIATYVPSTYVKIIEGVRDVFIKKEEGIED